MNLKPLTEHLLEWLSLKEAADAHLRLHLSKRHIIGESHALAQIYYYSFGIAHYTNADYSLYMCRLHSHEVIKLISCSTKLSMGSAV